MDEVTREAIRIRDRLVGAGKEFRYNIVMGRGKAELNELDAKACEDAASMLQKLDTEVFRLRQAIGLLYYGRMDRIELQKIAQSWNEDPYSPYEKEAPWKETIVDYPTMNEVNKASKVQLGMWLRHLASPGMSAIGTGDDLLQGAIDRQSAIMNRITTRFHQKGGWDPATSKAIGWNSR